MNIKQAKQTSKHSIQFNLIYLFIKLNNNKKKLQSLYIQQQQNTNIHVWQQKENQINEEEAISENIIFAYSMSYLKKKNEMKNEDHIEDGHFYVL